MKHAMWAVTVLAFSLVSFIYGISFMGDICVDHLGNNRRETITSRTTLAQMFEEDGYNVLYIQASLCGK